MLPTVSRSVKLAATRYQQTTLLTSKNNNDLQQSSYRALQTDQDTIMTPRVVILHK